MKYLYLLLLLALCVPLAAQVTLPLDFESTTLTYEIEGFEGADSAIEANPDQTGENTSATVVRTIKTDGAQFFAGTSVNLDVPADFSENRGISLQVWSPKADIPVLIRLEDLGNDNGMQLVANTTVAGEWETLTVDFNSRIDENVDYVRVVVFFEFIDGLAGDGTTYYFDNVDTADVSGGAMVSLPVDFEDASIPYALEGFETAFASVLDNPLPGGENTSGRVAQITKPMGAPFFAGGFLGLDTPIDFSENQGISLQVWSPKADIPLRIKLENADASAFVETDVQIGAAVTWQTVTADFRGQLDPCVEYVRVVLFFEFIEGVMGDGSTYYFDNIAVADVGTFDPVVVLPVGFENDTIGYNLTGFEGADSAVETNPDQSGENTSATAVRTTKTDGAQFFAGTTLQLDGPIDFGDDRGIALQTWSPKADIPVRIQLEGCDAPTVFVDVNTTVASSWETLTADFTDLVDGSAAYNKVVVFFEFIPELAGDGSTYYYDNISVVEIGQPNEGPVALPVDFEADTLDYVVVGFEGADSAVEGNPDQSGSNTSATVVRTTKTVGASFFAGTYLDLDEPIDFSVNKGIAIDVWSPKIGIPVRVQIENDGADATFVDVNLDTLAGSDSQWQTITADFTNFIVEGQDYNRVTIFFEFIDGILGDGSTYYFDNIRTVEIEEEMEEDVELPITFEEDLNYDFEGFEGAASALAANPETNGENNSATVMETTKTDGAQFFAGTIVRLDVPIVWSDFSGISLQSYSPKADIPVRLKLQNADGSEFIELDVNTTVANEWETLQFDFADVIDPQQAFTSVVVFFEFVQDLPGDGTTYYFDNVQYEFPVSTVTLTQEDVKVYPNPTSAWWTVESPEAPLRSVRLFDVAGRQVLYTTPNAFIHNIDAANLPAGIYLLRAETADGVRTARLVKR